MNYKIGELVFYQLEQGLTIRYLPAIILNVCPKRIVIRDTCRFHMRRIVMPKTIFRFLPTGMMIV